MFTIKQKSKTITKTITTTTARILAVSMESKTVFETGVSFTGEYTKKEIEKAVCGVATEIDDISVVGVSVLSVEYIDEIYTCTVDDFLLFSTPTGEYADLKRRNNA